MLFSNEVLAELKRLGATHYTVARNFGDDTNMSVSSIHFFKGVTQNEVAYLMPSMKMKSPLSGFVECKRQNPIDAHFHEEIPFPSSLKAGIQREDIAHAENALSLGFTVNKSSNLNRLVTFDYKVGDPVPHHPLSFTLGNQYVWTARGGWRCGTLSPTKRFGNHSKVMSLSEALDEALKRNEESQDD